MSQTGSPSKEEGRATEALVADNEELVAYKSECKLKGRYVVLQFTTLATTRAHDISGVFYTALLRQCSPDEIDQILAGHTLTKGTVRVALIPSPIEDDQFPLVTHMMQEGFKPYFKLEEPEQEPPPGLTLRKKGKDRYVEVQREDFVLPGRNVPGAFGWRGLQVTRWMLRDEDFDPPSLPYSQDTHP